MYVLYFGSCPPRIHNIFPHTHTPPPLGTTAVVVRVVPHATGLLVSSLFPIHVHRSSSLARNSLWQYCPLWQLELHRLAD